jgi:teichuronic acid biosynthesis glycosyltransferase TuaG
MSQPLVSIITPVYNAEKFISETIQSVLDQTFEDFELLLIDDCSTDRSESIINEFVQKDKRIKYYKLSENSGAAVARNKGLEMAEGRFIAFIDSDDKWYRLKLERQLSFMQNQQVAFTYTKFEMINDDGSVRKKAADLPTKLDYTGLLKNTAIACSTVVIDKEVIGDFRMPLVRKGQDTATWLKILRNHKNAYLVDEVLNQYRVVEGSLSSNKLLALKRTWNTYKNLEKLPLHKAVYYFTHSVINAIRRRV